MLAGSRAPSPRTAAVHPRWGRLGRRIALPVTENERRRLLPFAVRAALASVGMACFLLLLKGFAAWHTGSVAMLGSLADTGLDQIGRASCRERVCQYV